jgi:Trk K+ transport system NAD-binding subunit
VVAIKRQQAVENSDPYIYTPRGNTPLQPGDILIVIGTPEQRFKLQREVLASQNFAAWIANLWN